MSAPRWLEQGRAWVEPLLAAALPGEGETPARLHAAMRYALLGGGKRLRPALVRLVCLELGGVEARAAPAAVALELVHTYSLVHDDLPAMDDDALRRGRATVHVAFDEATAILVGDGLLTLAFEVLCADEPVRAREHARVLARAAGSRGMVGGQALDLALGVEARASAEAELELIVDSHRRKTAALFGAIAFQWSGTLCSNGHWYMRMEPLAMLPGMLWALVDLERARGLGLVLPHWREALDGYLDAEREGRDA